MAVRSGPEPGEVVAGEEHAAGRVDDGGVEAELVLGEVAGQDERVRVVPPETAVLPVPQEVLAAGARDAAPRCA